MGVAAIAFDEMEDTKLKLPIRVLRNMCLRGNRL